MSQSKHSGITKIIERPGPLDGDNASGSEWLEALLDETLEKYPSHYGAAKQILDTITGKENGWRCEGAMETKLTVEGMEVTFDFQRVQGNWRRLLIMISMYEGKVTYRDYRELIWGERSGIKSLE